MSRLGLGFDTGGTYTDAVIMDLDSGEILERAKSLTTRSDLSIGIKGAIAEFDKDLLSKVVTVCLSSTLATNSIVEGKGCRVGLVLIGSQITVSANVDYSIMIKGSHTATGKVDEPLDIEAARKFLTSIKGKVDCIAVTGFMSVRNPEHEQEVAALAKEILKVPVVCGYELSSGLGFNERTITCIMNARLIPVIEELIQSVNKVLGEFGIDAPLMIVKGDGSVMSEEMAKIRPVETILSGPASSINGAKKLSGKDNAIVVDIGGTTTDIGIVRDGKPRLDPEGALIGGYRTRVMAAEITTAGMGGDSRIVVNPGRPVLTPIRAIPLCVAAQRWPKVAEALAGLAGMDPAPMMKELSKPGRQVLASEMVLTMRMPPEGYSINEANTELLKLAFDEPCSVLEAAERLGRETSEFYLESLEEMGLIQRVGFTPTDVLHADGTYTEFDAEASKAAAAYLAALAGMDADRFVSECRKAIRTKLCRELMDALITEDSGEPDLGRTGADLLSKAITCEHAKDFGCFFKLDKPIIGIGAPSGVYIRWVGDVLGTDVLISEDSDVGNAVGAICASVSESVKFQITPMKAVEGSAYEVFSRFGRAIYTTMDEAVERCTEQGREFVTKAALDNNAECVEVTVDLDRRSYILNFGSTDLEEAVLVVTAAGKPRMF